MSYPRKSTNTSIGLFNVRHTSEAVQGEHRCTKGPSLSCSNDMADLVGNGLNVYNQTESWSPTNCVPLSTSLNFWNLCIFFGTNVFAHAATIHPRTGATKLNSVKRMGYMLVAPITAGTVATHAIITFILGVKKGGLKWTHFLSAKEGLQEAIPVGGVGIQIPRDLAPVVAGRWKLVGDERHSLMLSHERSHPYRTSREPHIPTSDALLEFILPPQSRLPAYKDHKFYPSSSFASELIAVVQLGYGVYQLVVQYGSEITVMGLSSPYCCAIPYLFMSLINLIANILMPSYSHVVIIPPKEASLTRTSSLTHLPSYRAFHSEHKVSLPPTNPSVSRSPSTATAIAENNSITASIDKGITETEDLEAAKKHNFVQRSHWSIGNRYGTNEFEWDPQYLCIRASLLRGPIPEKDGFTEEQRKKLVGRSNPHLAFVTWAMHWSWWGKGPGIRASSSWSRETHPSKEKERELELWLERHYPGVETSIHARPLRVYQWSRYISVFITLVVSTAILGGLTRFKFMVGVYAGRFISWIYIPPTILLIPFFILELKKTSVGFYASADVFSRYLTILVCQTDRKDC